MSEPTTFEVLLFLAGGLMGFRIMLYPFLKAMYKPDKWHIYPLCLLITHDWSESHTPESEGYQPKLKTCHRCGMDKKANPPAPLVP